MLIPTGQSILHCRTAMTSIKAIDQQLEGVGIIEKDDHNDIIMTWYVIEAPNRMFSVG